METVAVSIVFVMCIIHDLGKITEMSQPNEINYYEDWNQAFDWGSDFEDCKLRFKIGDCRYRIGEGNQMLGDWDWDFDWGQG